ncbi:transmembrane protein 45B-like [Lytechinus variegatus]|uniref:transmembrane protein 45B-like n=1 Tax=Lytechinus variegatus TaxID=7654 RepID=UPI001BB1DD15|nr:transmembrane protein 45B-like [Lytechinus variegatus]
MGSFLGHVANGMFFMGYAIIWMVHHAYLIQTSSGRLLRHDPSAKSKRRPIQRLPIIGMIVMLLCSVGLIIGENVHPVMKWRFVNETGVWINGIVWQHCTMALFFGLYSVVNLLKHTCLPSAAKYEMLFAALAFFVEGFVFLLHTILIKEHSTLSHIVHYLLQIPIWISFFVSLSEAFVKNHHLKLAYIRTVCTLQQGTWFVQMAFILYINQWGDGESDHVYSTLFFSWHIFMNLIILIIVYNVTALIVRRCYSSTLGNDSVYTQLIQSEEQDEKIGLDIIEERGS